MVIPAVNDGLYGRMDYTYVLHSSRPCLPPFMTLTASSMALKHMKPSEVLLWAVGQLTARDLQE